HLLASLADVPPMAVRHLHDQAPPVQPLEHPAHRRALTAALADILGGPIQRPPDVGVAEAVQQVLTGQYGPEQPHICRAGRVDAGKPPAPTPPPARSPPPPDETPAPGRPPPPARRGTAGSTPAPPRGSGTG